MGEVEVQGRAGVVGVLACEQGVSCYGTKKGFAGDVSHGYVVFVVLAILVAVLVISVLIFRVGILVAVPDQVLQGLEEVTEEVLVDEAPLAPRP